MTSKNSNLSLYNSKYLKYKNKYLNLSNIYGGGLEEDMERWKYFIDTIKKSKDTDEKFLRDEAKYFFRIGWIGPNFPIDGKSFSQIEQPEKTTSEKMNSTNLLKKLQNQYGQEEGMNIWLNHVREIDNKFHRFIEQLYDDIFNIQEAEHLLNLGWIGPNFPLPGGSFCQREAQPSEIKASEARPLKVGFVASQANPQTKKTGINPQPLKVGFNASPTNPQTKKTGINPQPFKVEFNASPTNPQTRKTGINPTRCMFGEECSRYKRGECTFTH
jgi:hypothetical protein